MNLRSCAMLVLALCAPAAAPAAITLQRTYDGPIAGAEFGAACAVIGDMDGDGFAEFAIGAPGDATGGPDAGRVFIFKGGPVLPDEPTWVITGAPGDRLGTSLAAGRVDGGFDFVPDLVIGAPGSLAGQTGRVVIAYGGSPLGARALRSVSGTAADGRYGWAVAVLKYGASFVTVVVGAPEANGGTGEVHVLAPGDPPTETFVLTGAVAGEKFGYAVADAGAPHGYLNPEFLVGAPESSDGAPAAGRFSWFSWDQFGKQWQSGGATGATAGERLGWSIAGGHDTNPNYFEPSDDLAVGAPGAYPVGPADRGRAAIYADQPFEILGPAPGADLGSTVRMMEDVTGNWLPELAIAEVGAVRVYTGPLRPGASPAATLPAEPSDGRFGHAISNSGHISKETGSHRQFLVGAPDYGGTGRAYLYGDPSPVTGVETPGAVTAVALGPPRPNPASAKVTFSVDLPRAMAVRIAVYDVAGREVARLRDGWMGPGRTNIEWDARAGAGPGLYFIAVDAGGARVGKRLAVAR